MSIKRDLLSLFGARGIGVLIPFLATPYLTRILGPASFGLYAVGIAIGGILSMLVKFGFEMSSLRAGSQCAEDSYKFRKVLVETLLAQVCLWASCGFIIVLVGMWLQLEPDFEFLLLVVFLLSLPLSLYPQWSLQALGLYQKSAALSVGSRLVCLVFTFLAVREPEDFVWAVVLHMAWPLLAMPLAYLSIKSKLGIRVFTRARFSGAYFRALESLPYFLSVLFGTLYTSMNVIYLGWFGISSAQVGMFASSQQIVSATRIPADPLKQVFFPRLVRSFLTPILFEKYRKAYLLLLGIGYFFMSILLLWMAGPIIQLYLGPDFIGATAIVQVTSLSLVPWALATWAETILQARGQVKRSLLGPVVGGTVHLLIAGPFILNWGVTGIAAAIVVTQFVILSILFWQVRRD